MRGILIATSAAFFACKSTEATQQAERTEDACKAALAHYDPWANTALPPGCKAPEPPCDAGEASRVAWIFTTFQYEEGRPVTPHDAGYRAEGRCHRDLVAKGMTCDPKEVASMHYDSQYVDAAAVLGFQAMVCERISDGTRERFDSFMRGRPHAKPAAPTVAPRAKRIEAIEPDPDRVPMGTAKSFGSH